MPFLLRIWYQPPIPRSGLSHIASRTLAWLLELLPRALKRWTVEEPGKEEQGAGLPRCVIPNPQKEW
jgi:hypothetical protein